MGSVWRLCVFQCKTAILWTWLSVIEIEALFEYVSIFQADMSDLLMNERQQPSNAAAAMPLPWEKTFFFQRTSQSWVTAIRLQRGKSDFDEHVHLFPPLLRKSKPKDWLSKATQDKNLFKKPHCFKIPRRRRRGVKVLISLFFA